jgi:O-antigen/teichoic acid export membrane protein
VVRDSAITLVARAIILVLSLATSVVVSRVLGPSTKGSYSIIVLILGITVLVCLFGFASSNVYYGARDPGELPVLAGNSIIAGLGFGLLGAAVLVSLTWLPAFQKYLIGNSVAPSLVRTLAVTVPVILVAANLREIVRADGRIFQYNLLGVVGAAAGLASVVIAVWLLDLGLTGAVTSWVIVQIVSLGAAVWLTARVTKRRFYFDLSLLRRNLTFGLRLHLGNLAQFLNYRLDILLVGFFLGPTEVGLYATATALAERIWELPHAIRTVMLHRVAVATSSLDANVLTARAVRIVSLLLLFVGIGIVLGARMLVIALYGSEYVGSIQPLVVLVPGIWALGIGKLLATHMAGSGRPEVGTYAAVISIVFTVALDVVLIPTMGIVGAALASSVAYTIAVVVLLVFFIRTSGLQVSEILIPQRDDFRRLAVGVTQMFALSHPR